MSLTLVSPSFSEGSDERKAAYAQFTAAFVEGDVGVGDRDAFSQGLFADKLWAGRLLGEVFALP